MSDRSITIAVTNDTAEETAESFRVTLANAAGGATIEGAAEFDIEIQANDSVVVPPPPGGGGGGGGALASELLLLLGFWLLAALAQQQARRRTHDRADQVRLRHHGDT